MEVFGGGSDPESPPSNALLPHQCREERGPTAGSSALPLKAGLTRFRSGPPESYRAAVTAGCIISPHESPLLAVLGWVPAKQHLEGIWQNVPCLQPQRLAPERPKERHQGWAESSWAKRSFATGLKQSFEGPFLKDFCSGLGENGLTSSCCFFPRTGYSQGSSIKVSSGRKECFHHMSKASARCCSLAGSQMKMAPLPCQPCDVSARI